MYVVGRPTDGSVHFRETKKQQMFSPCETEHLFEILE